MACNAVRGSAEGCDGRPGTCDTCPFADMKSRNAGGPSNLDSMNRMNRWYSSKTKTKKCPGVRDKRSVGSSDIREIGLNFRHTLTLELSVESSLNVYLKDES